MLLHKIELEDTFLLKHLKIKPLFEIEVVLMQLQEVIQRDLIHLLPSLQNGDLHGTTFQHSSQNIDLVQVRYRAVQSQDCLYLLPFKESLLHTHLFSNLNY